MQRLTAGRTAIVVAHRLSTVRALDRILVFDAGRVTAFRRVEVRARVGGMAGVTVLGTLLVPLLYTLIARDADPGNGMDVAALRPGRLERADSSPLGRQRRDQESL